MSKKSKCFNNRELSWMHFNERVLEEADNEDVPLAERLSYLKIYQSNLDEFFMVRVAGYMTQKKQMQLDGSDGMTSREQIQAIMKENKRLEKKKTKIFEKLMGMLEREGIIQLQAEHMATNEKKDTLACFLRNVLPFVAPMCVEEYQLFPFLKSKEQYVVAVLKSKNGRTKWGIVPCDTGVCKRWMEVPEKSGTYILLEHMMYEYVDKIFPEYEVKEKNIVRVTRSADLDAMELYDHDMEYREFMKHFIKKRSRLRPVRMEIFGELSEVRKKQLGEKIGITKSHILLVKTPMDFAFLEKLRGSLRKKKSLFYPFRTPRVPDLLEKGQSILQQVMEKDLLFCYPYESMTPFLNLLFQAAESEEVISIFMTLYRVAEKSQVIDALIHAAEQGKKVVVLLELRARFDEENNIKMSDRLEDAGCTVLYGLEGYKVHSKLCLITMKNQKGISYITQIGTGNYNEQTSSVYTDCSLLTSNREIGEDVYGVFCCLAEGKVVEHASHLLVAPCRMQEEILKKIDKEIQMAKEGRPAYIGIKVNGLSDKKIMNKLIEASKAGVPIQLIVRGICCLRPGMEGYTEHIKIISIVGRFLEHSRIYRFGTGEREEVYLSSADLLTRNMCRRVEVAVPVYDEKIKKRIQEMFVRMMEDDAKGKEQDKEGNYKRRKLGNQLFNSQEYFCTMGK